MTARGSPKVLQVMLKLKQSRLAAVKVSRVFIALSAAALIALKLLQPFLETLWYSREGAA